MGRIKSEGTPIRPKGTRTMVGRITALRATAIAVLVASLMVIGGCTTPVEPAISSAPDFDDYVARSRCVRQQINRMLADPRESDRGAYDMASYAVGRCSQSVWHKIMRSSGSPEQRLDDMRQDELSERQNALGMIIDARTQR